ncbi:MAG: hypothetical protein RLY66_479 [Candidatus Parcubacteria bacterium]|jgi:uncharacterized membrane protein HdeD (DUF308 family)
MKHSELKYTLLSIAFFCCSTYAFYKSSLIFGFPLAIIGIILAIKSTNTKKPKWVQGLIIAIIAILLGSFVAGLFLGSVTG